MNFNEHGVPHFHASYGEYDASISIAKFEILGGSLPGRAMQLVRDWGMLHQDELGETGNGLGGTKQCNASLR